MSKKDKKQPDILQIRSKYELWNDFIVPGMENRTDREVIRAQLKEAVRKEVFDQMCWRMKVTDLNDAPHTPENEQIAASIAKETKKKWAALIRMCDERLQTMHLISESDLENLFGEPEDISEDDGYEFEEVEDPDEEGGDWDGDEKTAEWPEDSVVIDEKTAEWLKMRGADLDGLSDGPFEPKRESWTP